MGRWSRPPKGGDSLVKILVLGTSDRGFKSHPPHHWPEQQPVAGLGMLISVHVTSNAREPRLTKIGETTFEARVDEKAVGGRANKRLLEILSKHFEVPKSRIMIVRGLKSRDKVIEIILENRANHSTRDKL